MASHYLRRREVKCPRARRVHTPEHLVERFQSAGDRRGAQVHILRIGLDPGHETKLVHIQMAQSLSKCIAPFTTFICELGGQAYYGLAFLAVQCPQNDLPNVFGLAARSSGTNCFVIAADCFYLSSPLEPIPGRKVLAAGGHLNHTSCDAAVRPVLEGRLVSTQSIPKLKVWHTWM